LAQRDDWNRACFHIDISSTQQWIVLHKRNSSQTQSVRNRVDTNDKAFSVHFGARFRNERMWIISVLLMNFSNVTGSRNWSNKFMFGSIEINRRDKSLDLMWPNADYDATDCSKTDCIQRQIVFKDRLVLNVT
jgi:hypothetical protein